MSGGAGFYTFSNHKGKYHASLAKFPKGFSVVINSIIVQPRPEVGVDEVDEVRLPLANAAVCCCRVM